MLGAGLTLGSAIAVAVFGGVSDARTGHIPNWLTIGALGAALPLAFVQGGSADGAFQVGAGLAALGLSVLGAVVCGIGPLVAFVKGGMGGGDFKLLAAIGALLGPRLGLDAEFYAFALGALYVPAKLVWQGRLGETLWGALRALANPLRPKRARVALPDALKMRVRLGPAIAVGTSAACALAWMGA